MMFVGYCPLVPGTIGTLAAIPVYLLLVLSLPKLFYFLSLILIFCLGIWSAQFAESFYETKDPKPVVIDEAVGFMVTMLFIEPKLVVLTG